MASRLLSRTQLRAYLSDLPWHEIQNRIRHGKLPSPLWKVDPADMAARWDRKAVDRALDAESAIPATIEAQEQAWDRAFGLG